MSSNSKEFDIAFIGDSFTEGVGVNYEETFVGRITSQFNDLNIANLGVVSYSPSIYFTKLKYLLDNGYKFKRVIIYFDISDIYDDNRKWNIIIIIILQKSPKLLIVDRNCLLVDGRSQTDDEEANMERADRGRCVM